MVYKNEIIILSLFSKYIVTVVCEESMFICLLLFQAKTVEYM